MSFASTSSRVRELAAALPAEGTNPIGSKARAAIVNRIRRATPGLYPGSPRPWGFWEVFFPYYIQQQEEEHIVRLTDLEDDFFWSPFAVAVLSRRMYDCTTRLRSHLRIDEIDRFLAAQNAVLRRRVANWYAHMASRVPNEIATAFAAFPDANAQAEGRAEYIQGLTSASWINEKAAQYATGSWTDQSWELYHHWIKLTALNTPVDEVDRTINTVIAGGLPVPQALAAGSWHSWTSWFGRDVGGDDVGDATAEMLAEGFDYSSDRQPERHSFLFTASGQPGSLYRQPESSSCFAPGARVVLADGSLRPIEEIAVGDRVRTLDGDREVLLAARVPRAERPLFGFEGVDIAFTASHPFLVHDGTPADGGEYAAVDPLAMARAVPTASRFGIRSLADPAPSLVANADTGVRAAPAPPVRQVSTSEPILHDLYLRTGADGRSEFFVGDDTTQYLVSSEVPRFGEMPLTTSVLVRLLERCAPGMLAALADTPDPDFAESLARAMHSCAHTLLPAIGARLRTPGPALDDTDLPRRIADFASGLHGPEGYDTRLGALVDRFLAVFTPQIEAAFTLGWRNFDLTEDETAVLAVSLYGLRLHAGKCGLPAEDAVVTMTLNRDASSESRRLPVHPDASTDHTYYVCEDLAYFGSWKPLIGTPTEPSTTDLWRLGLGLSAADGERTAPISATAFLPTRIPTGFQEFSVPVLDADGREIGQALLDVRTLSPDGHAAELVERADWRPEHRRMVAANLAALAGDVIEDHFVRAVRNR